MNQMFSDMTPFFNADFAEKCFRDGVLIGWVIVDSPDQESFGGMVMSADTTAQGVAAELEVLDEGDQVEIAGNTYEVKRHGFRVEDGLVMNVPLKRLT